jgi:hypothetical protein
MRVQRAVVVSCLSAIVIGCAPRRAPDELVEPRAPVTLAVTNHHWSDMAIYVLRSGQRVRIMTVVAAHSASVVLRPELVGPGGEIRVLAYAIGGAGRYTSPRVYAAPGGTVTLSLENDLRRSSVVTW